MNRLLNNKKTLIDAESSGLRVILNQLSEDSTFAGKDSSYATHNFHAFAAKFPPQIPRLFIENLTEPGEVVLDPMLGSGTTVVESLLLGRQGIGFDIDPLAIHLSKIKISGVEYHKVQSHVNSILARAVNYLSNGSDIDDFLNSKFDLETKNFINYWFNKTTQRELSALVLAIDGTSDNSVRSFFQLVFSSIIITKSGGVSLARDLAHSRPHKDVNKNPKNAIEAFALRLKKLIPSLYQLPHGGNSFRIEQIDARKMPLDDDTIDLVVTSPPYANAIDYMRAHKFSLIWFGKSISELSSLRSQYVGSERISSTIDGYLPEFCNQILDKMHYLDKKKTKILKKYFLDMNLIIKEIQRILKPGKFCVIVVGNSTMRGYQVKTNECLESIGTQIGFEAVANISRKLDRDKRMMPASFRANGSGIELRMHEEYIIILRKS